MGARFPRFPICVISSTGALAPATQFHLKQTSFALFFPCHAATIVFVGIEQMRTAAANGVNYQSRFHISFVVPAELI